jgi:hypothetical protein
MGPRNNLLQSSRSNPHRVFLVALCLLGLSACSSGTSSVLAEVDLASGGARLTFQTEGRNTFTAGGVSCEADQAGSCSVLLPAADLLPAWNRLEIETKRRTDERLEARFFISDEFFGRECTVSRNGVTGDPEEMSFDVQCTFAEGFTGSIDGQPMNDGKATVSALRCLGELESLEVDVERPLLRGAIPLDVVGRKGSLRRGIPVAVPAPLVQVSLEGWATPWFEERISLKLDAEPGAVITVNGEPTTASAKDSVATLEVPVSVGPNEVVVLVSKEGHAPARHALAIEGRYPATPLFLDQTYAAHLTTDRKLLPLSGRTHREAKLYLNGRPVDHRAGRFELDAVLEEGKNDVQLLAVIEASRGRRARSLTRIDFEVLRTTAAPPEFGSVEPSLPTAELRSLASVAADPWAHVGSRVSFPMRIESISENLSTDGNCSARIEGLACSERVGGPVMLAWSVVQGWVCIGEQSPVVVEAALCPDAVEGDDVQIDGVVRSALGGRYQGMTRDRPSVDATSAVRLPATELLPSEQRERFRPELLEERRRAQKRRR